MMRRYGWGLVLIALGVMGFLQTTGLFNFGLALWPVFLTLAGGSLVWHSIKQRCCWFLLGLGMWVGGIGLFQILFNAGVTAIGGGDVARLGWPLLFVGVGVSFLLGGHHPWCSPAWRVGSLRHGLGDRHHGRERWVLDGDFDVNHGVGDVVIDLTTADITEGVHRVTVGVNVGDVVIRVPDNVNALVNAAVSIGQLQVFGENRSGLGSLTLRKQVVVADSKVELRIEARLSVGQLTVTQAPPYPGVAR